MVPGVPGSCEGKRRAKESDDQMPSGEERWREGEGGTRARVAIDGLREGRAGLTAVDVGEADGAVARGAATADGIAGRPRGPRRDGAVTDWRRGKRSDTARKSKGKRREGKKVRGWRKGEEEGKTEERGREGMERGQKEKKRKKGSSADW